MIHVESKLLTIRGGAEFEKFGDRYDYCVSVFIDGDRAHLFGLCGKFSWKDYKDIRNALIAFGVKSAHWERKKNGETKTKVVE